MIFTETKIKVADNSGGTLVKCIKVAGFLVRIIIAL